MAGISVFTAIPAPTSFQENKMKNIKGFALGLIVGLALAMSSIAFAQNTTQQDPSREKESCCAMASCCCQGGSCSMKDHDAKNHAAKEGSGNDSCALNHDHKSHSAEGGCCCCADSCDTKMKEQQKEKAKQG
jgi:hypothetical protein